MKNLKLKSVVIVAAIASLSACSSALDTGTCGDFVSEINNASSPEEAPIVASLEEKFADSAETDPSRIASALMSYCAVEVSNEGDTMRFVSGNPDAKLSKFSY